MFKIASRIRRWTSRVCAESQDLLFIAIFFFLGYICAYVMVFLDHLL